MENDKITTDDIANALINLSEDIRLCDNDTAKGLRTSKKKEILNSESEYSFSKFTNEIIKTKERKNK